MVGVINPAVEAIQKVDTNSDDPQVITQSITALTSTLDGAAKSLAALKVTTPELKKFSADYQAMCADAAKVAKEMAELVTTMSAKEKEVEGLSKGLEAAITKLTTVCSATPTPAECEAVGKTLAAAPSDMSKPGEATRFAASLRALSASDPALKGALDAVTKSAEDNAKLNEAATAMGQKAEAGGKTMELALAKEDPIVDGMKAFCSAP